MTRLYVHCSSITAIAVLVVLSIACGNRQTSRTVAQQTNQSAVQPQPQAGAQPTSATVPAAEKPSPVKSQPADATPPAPANTAATHEQVPSHNVVIPAGTFFDVRLGETLDTKRNRPGDRFTATLFRPVVLDGRTVLPRGTSCYGHLLAAKPSGRFKGRALMSLSLDSFELNGRRFDISTTHVGRESGGHKKRNWILIGGGSGAGAAIGALAGGPAGALIGAGAGAGAGTAGAAFTGKKNVRIPVETPLTFSLRSSLMLAN
jgi:hypothetical protein